MVAVQWKRLGGVSVCKALLIIWGVHSPKKIQKECCALAMNKSPVK